MQFTMQRTHYLHYFTTKMQMLTLLKIQYDNPSSFTILISITNTTITNYTWNKIKLLMPLKIFTP